MSQLNNAFKASVEASIAGLHTLADVLKKEKMALTGDNAQTLEDVVSEKLQVLTELQHSVQARDQIQKQAQVPPGLAGGEAFVREHFSVTEMASNWKILVSLSKEVDELNSQNGKLALAGERTTRQALGILTGRDQKQDTYKRGLAGKASLGGYSLGKC